MQAIANTLQSLLTSLPPPPTDKDTLDSHVKQALSQAKTYANPEGWRNQWEFVLRKEIFNLASTEGQALKDPKTTYYEQLSDRLDLICTFTEHDACDPVFPFTVLQDLLETQTISSCSHIFSWIESRAERLTEDMIPQKGKALVLLRTLNDLLRRLSNTGATTTFCGRILTFLSRVFPLGERSGVNLRGEYGPMWEGPGAKGHEMVGAPQRTSKETEKEHMEVDETKEELAAHTAETRRKEKEDFFYTFWSLQLPFSRPPLFAEPQTFSAFKDAVTKVLPIIKEATAKDRALMGSKANHTSTGASGPLKRKRESGVTESSSKSEYYFAKYLTSPELLDLEIADTHFRRQFLFQLLILLHHLLNFTKTAKVAWSTSRNRSLQIDFTLDPADAQWVQETITRTVEELRQTAPSGRQFSDTVQVILEREKNWIRWKNELCTPFDREPWREEVEIDGANKKFGLEHATEEVRKKMRMDPEDWPHRYGSAALTEIWEMGYRDLTDLEHPFQPGDVKDFVKKVKQEDARIEMRKKQLTKQAERIAQARAKAAGLKENTPVLTTPVPIPTPTPAPAAPTANGVPPETLAVPSPVPHTAPGTPAPVPAPAPVAVAIAEPVSVELPPDEQIQKYEENKQRWAWLALRTARDQYLQHFGKIGAGDVVVLAQEIEREAEREKAAAEAALTATATAAAAQAGASPGPGAAVGTDGDVKMEER